MMTETTSRGSSSTLFDSHSNSDGDIEEVKEFDDHKFYFGIHFRKSRVFNKFNGAVAAVLLLVVVVVVVLAVRGGDSDDQVQERPSRQSEVQQQVWEKADAKAQPASTNATTELLAYLDSAEFRSDIANISSLAGASSQDILLVIQKLVLSTPVHHNFPLLSGGLDVNLTVMMEQGFVPNYYTAYLEGYLTGGSSMTIQNYAETKVMGFPDFLNASNPNMTEALTRPQYTCINLYGISGGCLMFGQVSLVSRPSWIRNMTIISAMDTGLYTASCLNVSISGGPGGPGRNRTGGGGPGGNGNGNGGGPGGPGGGGGFLGMRNCSYWDSTVGTFDHFNHLVLPNVRLTGMSLGWLLQRRLNRVNFTSPAYYGSRSLMSFLEGDVAGALLIPESVNYLQLAAAGVIGTSAGAQAVAWAASEGWPLVWHQGITGNTIGTGAGGGGGGPNDGTRNNTRNGPPNGGPPGGGNQTGGGGGGPGGGGASLFSADVSTIDLVNFFLDPFSARNTTNISISDSDLETSQRAFTAQWSYFEANPSLLTNTNSTYWYRVWTDLWGSMSPALQLRYSDFDSCGDLEHCFAVQLSTGDCVCRTT